MSKGMIAALSLVLISTAPTIADARSNSGDTSTACLTSSARNLLARIRAQFGNVQIVSTCRPGARIAGTSHPSRHASGQAIDFRVPGRKAEVVRWLIANHRSGGTMTYRDMDHIHVDVGPRFVSLGAPSGRT
ncbi:MAG: D-Ala-D-Ala carboxypeptidase family metallohydrolase [Hyphomicrobium sp.]|uniref:YcbK family protein n=1 Tax=Hyphomicrobium sp. TaxID=82 RepID=UPI0039E38C72